MTTPGSSSGRFRPLSRISSLLLFLCLVFNITVAQIPSGYYNQAAGLSGAPLKTALHEIIKGHTKLSYTGLWSAFYATDDKPNGTVWDIYSDIPDGSPNGNPPYVYYFGTDQCSTTPGYENACYNREHSFPNSWFGGNESDTMFTDLFHLYPTDSYVNTRRSNYPYGQVGVPTWTSLNGSKLGPCITAGYTGTVFEPRDEFKGDLARTYFYMATRYESGIASWQSYSSADEVLDGTSFPCYDQWFLNLLLAWNEADPVSQKEIDRNNEIYLTYQHNRNPYIDHPEYVAAVWGPSVIKAEPTNHPTNFAALAGSPASSVIYISWADATTGTVIPDGYLIKGSSLSFSDISDPVDGTAVANSALNNNVGQGVQTFVFSGLAANTTYYFKIYSFTNSGSNINYKTLPLPIQSASLTTGVYTGTDPLQPGDIAIIEYGSVNPDKFSFITFKPLIPGTIITFTDNGFTSPTAVRTGEGFLIYTAPSLIPAGTVISWYNAMDITNTGWNSNNPSLFLFNESGDQLFAYLGNWGIDQTLLYGLNAGNSGWVPSGSASTNSSFPLGLTSNLNALTFPEKNGHYTLITIGTVNALGSFIAYPDNWTKSISIISTPSWNFTLTNSTTISQNAIVLDFMIFIGENLIIPVGKQLIVNGNFTRNN